MQDMLLLESGVLSLHFITPLSPSLGVFLQNHHVDGYYHVGVKWL